MRSLPLYTIGLVAFPLGLILTSGMAAGLSYPNDNRLGCVPSEYAVYGVCVLADPSECVGYEWWSHLSLEPQAGRRCILEPQPLSG